MKLSPAAEDNILTLLCWSNEHSSKIALQVPTELFSTRVYQQIAEKAISYITQFNVAPQTHIRDLFEEQLNHSNDESLFIKRTLDAMEKLYLELNAEFVLNQLDSFILSRKIYNVVNDVSDALHNGEIESAQQLLTSSIALNDDADAPGVFLHDAENWVDFLKENEQEDIFSSGIQTLDEYGVRPARQELFIFMAPTGKGKSWWAIEAGKNNVRDHKNVLHISTENSLRQTIMRYTQSFLSLTKKEAGALRLTLFQKDKLNRVSKLTFNEKVFEYIEGGISRAEIIQKLKPLNNRGKLYVKYYPSHVLTPSHLKSLCIQLENTHKFKPDIIIVDSPNLMSIDFRNYRLSLGYVFKELKRLAGELDAAIIATHQGNKSSVSAKLVTGSMVAEDFSIVQTADNFITYSQTAEEGELGLARILVYKARNERDKWIALISQKYDIGQFAMDSIYMNKYVEDEILNHIGGDDDENDEE